MTNDTPKEHFFDIVDADIRHRAELKNDGPIPVGAFTSYVDLFEHVKNHLEPIGDRNLVKEFPLVGRFTGGVIGNRHLPVKDLPETWVKIFVAFPGQQVFTGYISELPPYMDEALDVWVENPERPDVVAMTTFNLSYYNLIPHRRYSDLYLFPNPEDAVRYAQVR